MHKLLSWCCLHCTHMQPLHTCQPPPHPPPPAPCPAHRYVPDRAYLVSLQSHLQAQLPLCGPDALSMALWALAALQQPLPSHAWAQQWCDAALGVAGDFGPQALAHGLAGMAALRVQPPAALMQVRVCVDLSFCAGVCLCTVLLTCYVLHGVSVVCTYCC